MSEYDSASNFEHSSDSNDPESIPPVDTDSDAYSEVGDEMEAWTEEETSEVPSEEGEEGGTEESTNYPTGTVEGDNDGQPNDPDTDGGGVSEGDESLPELTPEDEEPEEQEPDNPDPSDDDPDNEGTEDEIPLIPLEPPVEVEVGIKSNVEPYPVRLALANSVKEKPIDYHTSRINKLINEASVEGLYEVVYRTKVRDYLVDELVDKYRKAGYLVTVKRYTQEIPTSSITIAWSTMSLRPQRPSRYR